MSNAIQFLESLGGSAEPMSAEQYARAVCRACILRSVTPTELAQRCGIAPLTMKHILTGSTQRTRISTMRRIAEELGMSLTQLLELSREDALDKM